MTTPTPGPTEPPPPSRASAGPAEASGAQLPRAAMIAGAFVLGLAALVAFASRGTPVWSSPREGTADRGELLATIGVLSVVTLVAAAAIALVVHHFIVSRRPDAPPLRTTLLRAVPIAIVALAVLALVTIARTELSPEEPTIAGDDPDEEITDRQTGRETDPVPRRGSGHLGDFNGDGRTQIGIDIDGDGTVDYVTWPTEPGADHADLGEGAGRLYLNRLFDGSLTGGVDENGDGTIDQIVTFDLDGDRTIDVAPGSSIDPDELFDLLDARDAGSDAPERETPDDADEPDRESSSSDDDDGGGGPDLGVLGPILLGLLAALAVAFIAAGVWSWYSSRRARDDQAAGDVPADAEHETAREAMAETVESSIDSMLADPDPRTAIIGAYARLLEGLAASGVGRLEHEAPMEHLQRALTTLDVRPEPLHRLIELFGMARFSTRPLTESHRVEALNGLRAAAADLAAAPLPPPEAVGAAR